MKNENKRNINIKKQLDSFIIENIYKYIYILI